MFKAIKSMRFSTFLRIYSVAFVMAFFAGSFIPQESAASAEEVTDTPPYDRSAWGRWSPTGQRGGGGCRWDSRHLLLRDIGRETNPGTLTTREQSGRACRVLTLTLVDRYTGERHTGPANKIDVDHLVPLAEAHRSGGWAWDYEKRLEFWNDPNNHVAVHERVNSRKSDIDPGGESQRGRRSEGWWPPDESQHCWYAERWIEVKLEWGLSFDNHEIVSLMEKLRSCWKAEAIADLCDRICTTSD